MNSENNWPEELNEGITSGPEEALRREIEKSKALKVERLQLRNEIENLLAQNNRLKEENRRLQEELRPRQKTSDP